MNKTIYKEMTEGYKQTPVGIIPKDWEVNKIEKCTIRIGDGIHATPKYSSDGKYYFINGNNLKSGEIVVNDSTKRVNEKEFNKHYRELTDRTILMSINGTIGNLAYYNNEDVVLGKSACYLNVNKEINLEYFYYQLGSYLIQKSFLKRLTGSTIKNLGLKEIRKTKLAIPPLPEQEQIASCLTTWDKGIEKLSTLIEAKKQQKKGLMQGLFNGQLRVDTSTSLSTGNGQLVQAKEREGFTEDWEEVMLKDISKVTKGKQLNRSELTDTGEFPSYSGGITPSGFTDEFNCKANTIIISEGGNSCGFVNFIDVDFWLGGHCYSINEKKRNTNKIFLYNLLKFNQLKIMTLRVGSGLPNVQKGTLEKFKLIIPPSLKEQSAIAEVLSTADKEIDLLEQKLEEMQLQKKGLMQVLLTGEKRLVDNH